MSGIPVRKKHNALPAARRHGHLAESPEKLTRFKFSRLFQSQPVYFVLSHSHGRTRKDDNMSALPACPKCKSEFTYEDAGLYICPECAHEWNAQAGAAPVEDGGKVYRDSAGNVLQDGDTVSVIKD